MWLLVLVTLTGVQAQEKVLLQNKAKEGQISTYKAEGELAVEFGGNKLNIELKIVQRQKITKVAANGEITQEVTTEEYEMSFNGNKAPADEEMLKGKEIIVIRPDGSRVSKEVEGRDEPEDSGGQEHLSQAFQIMFSDKPVGVGDKWSYEFKEDKKAGTLPGTAEFELVGFEKVNNVSCAHIKGSYRAKEGDAKLTATGETWIEVASGDAVRGEYKLDNIQFGPEDAGAPPATGTFRMTRVSGSPIGEVDAAGATGQDTPKEGDKTTEGAKPDDKKEEDKKKKEKTIEEIVKDYEKMEGLFTLYRKKEAGKETIYAEIKEELLNKLMFLQATVSDGPTSGMPAGMPINDILFKLVRRDEQILLVVPNIQFRVDPNKPIARAVKRSFADAYLEAFKIEAKNEERKSVLINISDFFRSDIAQVTQAAAAAGGGNYSIDREKTIYNYIKLFPENMVVQTAYHFTGGRGPQGAGGLAAILGGGGSAELADPRSMPMTVNYNLWVLPENNGYRPRLHDSRVGYFTVDFQDFSTDKEDQMVRYILRWNIEKADPNTAMSPPKQPIVFWLDNAIPVEYRDAVKKGILTWNKAFEKLGIKDAIVVNQMPDDADWDHADMRYNVIRWVASPGSGYAVALFRVNPLTGQILNASITVDANMTRFTKIEFDQMVNPLAALQALEKDNPAGHDYRLCQYAQQALPQAWLGMVSMNFLAPGRNATKVSEKKYMDDFIISVVSHEMGHIMGLRHNFISSIANSMNDLANGGRMREVGVTASVMDYTPFNQMALHSPNTEYWSTTIGPYDMWAIEYGYTPIMASSPEGEKTQLKALARRGTERGLGYQSDEVADNFDPLISRFDLASEPLQYWELRMKDTRELLKVLPDRIPERGESYYQFTRYFNMLISQYVMSGMVTSRYIGALHLRGNYRGDPNEKPPLVPANAADQRRALKLLRDYIFAKESFNFPKSVYLKLAPDPNPDLMSAIMGGMRQDAPIRDQISNMQSIILWRLFSPTVLSRVVNNEFKSAKPQEALTLAELFRTVSDAVWEEVRTGENVDSLRRQLQRNHLKAMVDMLVKPSTAIPDDAKMLARYHLRQLKAGIQKVLPNARDEYTRAHYSEVLDVVNKALDAKYMLGGQQPAAPSLRDLLGL
jgi:hypothetical protein